MSERGAKLFRNWAKRAKGFINFPADRDGRIDVLVYDLRNEAFEASIPIDEIEEEVGDLRDAVARGYDRGEVSL